MLPKPGGGERLLCIPTIRDRVDQTAAKLVLEPIFETNFEDSYGYRPNCGSFSGSSRSRGDWCGRSQPEARGLRAIELGDDRGDAFVGERGRQHRRLPLDGAADAAGRHRGLAGRPAGEPRQRGRHDRRHHAKHPVGAQLRGVGNGRSEVELFTRRLAGQIGVLKQVLALPYAPAAEVEPQLLHLLIHHRRLHGHQVAA
jgi:hypothetical protein